MHVRTFALTNTRTQELVSETAPVNEEVVRGTSVGAKPSLARVKRPILAFF
jgi:hypothetical protein